MKLIQTYKNKAGFTLIEVLVALLILVLTLVFAYRTFYGVAAMEMRSRQDSELRQDLFRAWSVVSQDLLHMRARPVRGQLGEFEPAYRAGAEPYLLEFTRGGLPSMPVSPGGMMRVAYQLDDEGGLYRVSWPGLDAPEAIEPQQRLLVSGLQEFTVEQLGSDNFFSPLWPPINQENAPLNLLPRMVRVSLVTLDGFEFSRLLPGVMPQPLPRENGRGDEQQDDDS